jgi:serine/threonine protein kinase
MEYVEGRSLAELLAERDARRGTLRTAEVAQVLGQVVAGVAHMHTSGWSHRDLKPVRHAHSLHKCSEPDGAIETARGLTPGPRAAQANIFLRERGGAGAGAGARAGARAYDVKVGDLGLCAKLQSVAGQHAGADSDEDAAVDDLVRRGGGGGG